MNKSSRNVKLEKKLFLKWLLNLRNFILFSLFALRKAHFKVKKSYSKNNLIFYPKNIKKILPINEKSSTWIKSLSFKLVEESKPSNVLNLKLASQVLELTFDELIDWSLEFEDSEDVESLHRWNWLLTALTDKDICNYKFGRWALCQIDEWCDKFITEIHNKSYLKPTPSRWQSYSVGERLANIALFCDLLSLTPSRKIQMSLETMAQFLSYNLEYFGEQTGNHVFNNARGLYLYAVKAENKELQHFAKSIIYRELPLLITEDGFLREGSSHYQFLFTRWVHEIQFIANRINDVKLISFLQLYLKNLSKCCSFFIINNENFPLFGDVSPDFSPEWTKNVGFVESLSNSGLTIVEEGSWENLFGLSLQPNLKKLTKSLEYKSSGWFRYEKGDFCLHTRCEAKAVSPYVGHFHNDLFSITLYYKGQPILVDTGRKNYVTSSEISLIGEGVEGHNSFKICGIPPVPLSKFRYPLKYMQSLSNVSMDKSLEIKSKVFSRVLGHSNVKREIVIENKTVNILDSILSKSICDGYVESFFHIDNSFFISKERNKRYKFTSEKLTFFLNINIADCLVEIYNSGEPESLIHREYGRSVQGICLKITSDLNYSLEKSYLFEFEI
jgi:hypothetical protein